MSLWIQQGVEMGRNERSAELNRMVRSAALTIDDRGSLTALARKAGVTATAIRIAINNGRFSVGLASAIEAAVGRDVLTREQLCPERFGDRA